MYLHWESRRGVGRGGLACEAWTTDARPATNPRNLVAASGSLPLTWMRIQVILGPPCPLKGQHSRPCCLPPVMKCVTAPGAGNG